MKVLIIEDDALAASFVENLILDNFSGFEIVGKAATVSQAAKIYNATKPDLLIMDINLGTHSSFDLFEYIDPQQLNIVFTSSYDQFALRAIKVDAVDYIMKPIHIEEFKTAIEKVKQKINAQKLAEKALNSIHIKGNTYRDRILILEDHKLIPLEIQSIIKMRSNGAYTEIYVNDGRLIVTSKNIGAYEKFFEGRGFLRIHDSCLINLSHILKYKPGVKAEVLLSDQSTEPLSRRRKKELLQFFGR